MWNHLIFIWLFNLIVLIQVLSHSLWLHIDLSIIIIEQREIFFYWIIIYLVNFKVGITYNILNLKLIGDIIFVIWEITIIEFEKEYELQWYWNSHSSCQEKWYCVTVDRKIHIFNSLLNNLIVIDTGAFILIMSLY